MADRRTQIEQALERLSRRQRALDFQWLAFHLCKNKWSDLAATEWFKDGGEDGLTIPSTGSDGKKRSLACSITGTIKKVRDDCKRIKERNQNIDILIFCTPQSLSNLKISEWRKNIIKEFDHDLCVIPKASIIADLERPKNRWLCKEYLDLDFTDEPDAKTLKKKIREAAQQYLSNWKTEYRYNETHQIELSLKLVIEETHHNYKFINLEKLSSAIRYSRHFILKGSPGAGKTITLLQLASYLLNQNKNLIPIFISLSEWSIEARDLFTFIAQQPSFVERNISDKDIAFLNKEGMFTFLLNGWNEIPQENILHLNQLLKNVVRNSPASSFVITTRETEIPPPIINADIVYVEPLDASQRRNIIKKHKIKEANNLINIIENNSTLDEITRTPLFFSSFVEISKKSNVIPSSKYELLREFIKNAEAEHEVFLRTSAVGGFHDRYLSWLAVSFINQGLTGSSILEAQKNVAECSEVLVNERLISQIPNAKTVMDILIDYHILIRSHDNNLVRFVHQQFQEWCAANYLYDTLILIRKGNDSAAISQFQKDILNKPIWEESLKFLIEKLVSEDEHLTGVISNVLHWIIPVDLNLASKIYKWAGNKISDEVMEELSFALRQVYNYPDNHHKTFALSAIFASTSPDFTDIVLPLIENKDDQVRLHTYSIWEPFPLSCLGDNWQVRISNWPEEQLVELIFQIGWNAELPNLKIVTEFAQKDKRIAIRVAALQVLAQNGAFEELEKILNYIDWSKEKYFELIDWLPKYILKKFSIKIRAAIQNIKNSKTLLKILLKLVDVEDMDALKLLKEVVEKNSIEAKIIIKRCLPRISVHSNKWVQDWLSNKLLQGQLWEELNQEMYSYEGGVENLQQYFKNADLNVLRKLSKMVFSSRLDLKLFRKRIAIFLKINPDFAANTLLKEYITIDSKLKKDRNNKVIREKESIIYHSIKDIPFNLRVNAVLNYSNLKTTYDGISKILLYLRSYNDDTEIQTTSISPKNRNLLRKRLFEWYKLNLSSPTDHGQIGANFAEVLGIIGTSKDLKIIERWIRYDQKRDREEYIDWKKKYDSWQKNKQQKVFPPATYVKHMWSRQYVNAITNIKSQESIKLLLRLLNDPDYIGQSTYALVNIFRPNQDNRIGMFLSKPNYENIAINRTKRDVNKSNNDNEQIFEIANKVQSAINELIDKHEIYGSDGFMLHEISLAATELSHIANENVISTILRLAKYEECRYDIPRALENLILNGIKLPGNMTLKAIDPIITKFEEDYLNNNQNGFSNINRCIRVLLFSDKPSLGIERLNRLLNKRVFSLEIRETVEAMGYCSAKSVMDFLIELENKPELLKFCYPQWITAFASYSNPKIRKTFINQLDRFIIEGQIEGFRRSEIEYHFEEAIYKLAKNDKTFWNEIETRCKTSKSDKERILLADVLDKFENIDDVLLSISLIRDDSDIPIPQKIFEIIENNITTEIYTGQSNSYYREPKSCDKLRELLFDLVINDNSRKKSALTLLLFIETIRAEFGKPIDESRHPKIDKMSELKRPWPLILN